MDEEDRTSVGSDGAFERLEVEEPAVSVGERVGDEAHVLKIGEKFEQRIAGLGEEKFVAGIAEEAEDVRVGLAGAGGEKKRFRIDSSLVVVEIVARDFAA